MDVFVVEQTDQKEEHELDLEDTVRGEGRGKTKEGTGTNSCEGDAAKGNKFSSNTTSQDT